MTHPTKESTSILTYLIVAMVGVGAGSVIWVLASSMAPDASQRHDDAARTIYIGDMQPGEHLYVEFEDSPIVIDYRTLEETAETMQTDLSTLPKPVSADRRVDPAYPQWFVGHAICTYRGGSYLHGPGEASNYGDDGYVCPLCAANYDGLGRVISGPANENLPLPEYRFEEGGYLKILAKYRRTSP